MKKLLEFERIKRILSELESKITIASLPIENLVLKDELSERPFVKGDYLGGKNKYFSLSGKINIPLAYRRTELDLAVYSSTTEWDNTTNPQIKIYLDGEFIQGLDVKHRNLRLTAQQSSKEELELRIELFSGREAKKFPLFIELRQVDLPTYELYYDLYVLWDSLRSLQEQDYTYQFYEKQLGKAVNCIKFFAPYSKSYYDGIREARLILQEAFYDKASEDNKENVPTVSVVGHTHIDLAWLWTVAQAVEKGERSFATVLKLMDEFTDYTFIQSQPQMYQFIKEQYPQLYKKIKAKIIEGRWEPEGAMWVEADCNLTSGESLVRQFLYGKRFLKEEFGKESNILWLPDVFGYSAALPQILKKTNTLYFMTTKLSWNQFNQIPYDSFYWQGIDGSRVLTHFITTISEGYSPTPYYTTYNGLLEPYVVKKSWERYVDKDVHNEILIAYGYGDGGGGPTREMLETLKRMKNGLPGMPMVKPTTANQFFAGLAEKLTDQTEKEWIGELYFEYHRGTYTSIGKNKKNNRKAEVMLQTLEKLFSTQAFAEYPQAFLEKLWKNVLLNQFHDILPGSAIKEVYDQTDKEYDEMFKKMRDEVQKQFCPNEKGEYLYIFNPLGRKRSTVVDLPLKKAETIIVNQKMVTTQPTHDGKTIARIDQLPSVGGNYYEIVDHPSDQVEFTPKWLSKQFETPDFLIEFDENFFMKRVLDKQHNRELVSQGKIFNELVVYEDLPLQFDAWDIDLYYKKKPAVVSELIEAVIVERGTIRDTLKIARRFYHSTITQWIHFMHGTAKIDFATEVDWHEQHALLKANFPVPVNTTNATFDIQFGNVERSVHKNTSWDKARFEVCAQKWVDMSEGNYGVSLMTDAKYGYDTSYQHIGLSLIKSATDPYPEADQGMHTFTYSIYCHEGTWKEANTVCLAEDLNTPCLIFRQAEKELKEGDFVATNKANILIDTLKKAEDDSALIVRAYENENKTTKAVFTFAHKLKKVELCDLLENSLCSLAIIDDYSVDVTFKPFEIQTLKIYFAQYEEY